MLSTYPFLNIDNLGKLSKRQYIELLTEAFNIASLNFGGQYEYENEKEIKQRSELEFIEHGGLKWLRTEDA